MTEAAGQKTERSRGLTPGNWIAIAAISATVLGGILGGVLSVALREHNARITNIESTTTRIAAYQAELAGTLKAINERMNGMEQRSEERQNAMEQRFDERLSRIERSIERVIEIHIAGTAPAATTPPGE